MNTVIDIITLLSIIVGVVTTVWTLVNNNKNNIRARMAERITQKRIEWIDDFKAYTAKYLSLVRHYDEANVAEIYRLDREIRFMLLSEKIGEEKKADMPIKPDVVIEELMTDILTQIDKNDVNDNINKKIERLSAFCRVHAKFAWDRAKAEIERNLDANTSYIELYDVDDCNVIHYYKSKEAYLAEKK